MPTDGTGSPHSSTDGQDAQDPLAVPGLQRQSTDELLEDVVAVAAEMNDDEWAAEVVNDMVAAAQGALPASQVVEAFNNGEGGEGVLAAAAAPAAP